MKKTILYRLFGIGKIPAQYAAAIQTEGIVLSDEGIQGTVTYRNFRSPQRYANWKRQWRTASIALTNTRLIAFQYAGLTIDVPFRMNVFARCNFRSKTEIHYSSRLTRRCFTRIGREILNIAFKRRSRKHFWTNCVKRLSEICLMYPKLKEFTIQLI